jgi:type II secretory pathway pseudopilin PulG
MTFIEILAAALIIGTCLAAVVSLWYFAFSLSVQTDRQGIAYAVARHAIEEVKQTGFAYTAIGAPSVSGGPSTLATTLYYDKNGENESSVQGSNVYKVVRTVATDKSATTGAGVNVPADDATITITVAVSLASGGAAVYTTGTTLVRSGI